MRARLLQIAGVAVACLAIAGVGIAGARGKAETKVTIKGPNGDFQGKIKSDKSKCLGGRKVIVYKLRGGAPDRDNDQKIASDISERAGDVGTWSVGNTGEKKGAFYAYAKKSSGCKAGYSKVISP